MRNFNLEGRVIGVPYQALHEESSIQKYPIGTVWEDNQGRRFRYCRAAEEIGLPIRGCPNLAYVPWNAENINRLVTSYAAAKKGENSVVVVHGAGAHALDDFQGGIITFYNIDGLGATYHHTYGVDGNDASIDTTHTRIYLSEPLIRNMTTGGADLYQSPWRNVGSSSSGTCGGYASIVCIPHIAVQNGYFFWGQTRGPCWITPNEGITTANVRMMYFHSNGTVIDAGADTSLQLAGYIIHRGDGAEDDSQIMLMLE